MFLAHQNVSGYCALPYFMPVHGFYSWLFRKWVATILICHTDYDDYSWLSSMWVPVPCYIYGLWCLFLAFQAVSGYCALPYFMPVYKIFSMWVSVPCYIYASSCACSWLFRLWVTTVPCCISCLIMVIVLGFSGCEWLLCLALFYVWSWCLFLTLQRVSGPCALPCFMLVYNTYHWPQLVSICALLYLCLFMMPVLGF